MTSYCPVGPPGPHVNGVNDLHPRRFEVPPVAGDHDEAKGKRARRDQAVLDRHGPPARAETCQQVRPAKARFCVDRHTSDSAHDLGEPQLEGVPTPSRPQQSDPEPDFSKHHRIHGDVLFVVPQPLHDPWIGARLRSLRKDVGVNEVFH